MTTSDKKTVDGTQKEYDPIETESSIGESQERVPADVDKVQRTEANPTPSVAASDIDQKYNVHGSIHEASILDRLTDSVVHDIWDRQWDQVNILDAPTPREGMVQRWIRTSTLSQDDPANLNRQIQQGWIPRRADSVRADLLPPTINHGQFRGCIIVEGMVLCEMPAERAAKRREAQREKTRRQTASLQSDIDRANAGHVKGLGLGTIGRETHSKATTGVMPVAAPDD